MIRNNNQFVVLFGFCLLVIMMSISSAAFAEDIPRQDLTCVEKATDQKKQQCVNHLKRTQLKAKKLSPQIRVEEIKRDNDFDLSKLYPFIVGSGLVN